MSIEKLRTLARELAGEAWDYDHRTITGAKRRKATDEQIPNTRGRFNPAPPSLLQQRGSRTTNHRKGQLIRLVEIVLGNTQQQTLPTRYSLLREPGCTINTFRFTGHTWLISRIVSRVSVSPTS